MNTHFKLDITLLFTRVMLGAVIFAHGAQKLFGWFGGYGFDGTMSFFTSAMGFPYALALLIILGESIGMIGLVLGIFSRFLAGVVMALMTGAILTVHLKEGFFMNWFGTQTGEGFEYHLLAISLAAVTLVNGAGAYSLDSVFVGKFFAGWFNRKAKSGNK